MRRILAYVLCVSMLFVMVLGTTGFAAVNDESRGSITVNGVQNGVTVKAYKIIQVNFKEGYFTGYSYVDSVKSWMKTKTETGKDYASLADDISALGKKSSTFQEGFYADLAAAITANPASFGLVTYNSPTKSGSALVFNPVELGQYLLLAEGGDYIYHATVATVAPKLVNNEYQVENAVVDIKSRKVTIDKKVNGAEEAVAGLGETVNYVVTADVPVYPANSINKNFVIFDQLSAGLAYTANSIKVEGIKADSTVTDITSVASPSIVGNAIVIDFSSKYNDITIYKAIKVSYQATITADAVVGGTGNDNTATLIYANNPNNSSSSTPKTDISKVYTYGLQVVKVDGDDTTTKLAGAIFRLEIKDENGDWKDVGRTPAELTTDAKGEITVKQLKPGFYRLVELQAPDGYNMLTSPIEFTITADKDTNNKLTGTINNTYGSDTAICYLTKTINNFKTLLPSTGGMGTVIFTVVGIVLMAGAVAFLIIRKRMSSAIK